MPANLMDFCPVCNGWDRQLLLNLDNVPYSCAQLFGSVNESKDSVHCELEITLCNDCGHIWNAAYREEFESLYNDDYHSSVTESIQGRQYQDSLAKRLSRLLGTENMEVLEIGCGDGYFLSAMSRYCASAMGFEPSSTYGIAANRLGIEVKNEIFQIGCHRANLESSDLIVMRHVLEHISGVQGMLKELSVRSRKPSYLFIEVPNIIHSLKNNLFFDFYHDHIHYFSAESLQKLAYASGWRCSSIIDGSDEFLRIVFRNSEDMANSMLNTCKTDFSQDSERSIGEVKLAVSEFERQFTDWRTQLQSILRGLKSGGNRIAVWGAGARGLALLAGLGLEEGFFQYAIDSDPNKHGKYLPSVYLEVRPPDELSSDDIDCILVTSYTYFEEICINLNQFRKNGGKIVKIYPVPQVID